MNAALDNKPSGNEGEPEPNLSDYKKIVQEKERIQKILENKVRELDRSNKELEEFAYVASHDLQEPLRKITSFSERLKEKLPQNIEPDVQMYLTRMLAATSNMRMLIDNLLEFSRTRRNSEPFIQTDLNAIVAEAKADLELKIEENSAVIECGQLPVISAIPLQMKQLFTNLFSNAIKFRKPVENPQIKVTGRELSRTEKENYHLKTDEGAFLITVQDNGIGFEPQYALKIFQIFQRLHGKVEYPGSGIGLAICKKIVDNHKGVLYAESTAGAGATFTIILPQHQTDTHE